MATIAKQMGGFYGGLCPKMFQRKRTQECENDALDMLEAYLDFSKITQEQYKIARNDILIAPHDDAISDIMTRIRHKIKW